MLNIAGEISEVRRGQNTSSLNPERSKLYAVNVHSFRFLVLNIFLALSSFYPQIKQIKQPIIIGKTAVSDLYIYVLSLDGDL